MKDTNKTGGAFPEEVKRLRQKLKELENADEQLRIAYQQLSASEQQLKAANQQLAANNQQLSASEQQLRAYNQQLIASEETLRYEKQFSEGIINTSSAIIVGLDKNHIIQTFNKGAEIITDYKKDEVIGKDWFKIFFPAENMNEMNKVWENAWGILSHSYINPILSKTGKKKIISWQTTGFYEDEDTTKHLLISIGEDITERKLTEGALKQSETKLRNIFENSTNLFYSHNTDHVITYLSPQVNEILGYTEEEAMVKWTELASDNPINDIGFDKTNKAINSGEVQGAYHLELVRKDGEKIWVEVRESPLLQNGKTTAIVGSITDITERKRAEQVQTVIHNISNAVTITDNIDEFVAFVKDELGTIIKTNNFYIALYDEKSDTLTLPYHRDEKDELENIPAGKTLTSYVVRTGRSLLANKEVKNKLVRSGEVELLGADSKVWLGTPLLIKGKTIGAMVLQSYDSEKDYDEPDMEMLKIISQQLSISLERIRTEDELRAALEKAVESDRLKSAFLSNMSHEIRTPMNGIMGFINLLNEPGVSASARNKYTDIINKSSDRLLSTINNIIDISKIDAGQMKAINTETSINMLMEELHQFFNPEAKTKGLLFSYSSAHTKVETSILTDNDKLHGILTNLIKNAIKYTEKGEIIYGYTLKESFIEFFVQDSGIGVPKHRQKAIFNRFEQADIEDTRAYEGSGLGLAISKAYVEMLRGEIWLESEEENVAGGKAGWSKFMFTIPYNNKQADKMKKSHERTQPEEEEIKTKNKNILIAEDEDDSSLFLKETLKNKFREIYIVKTGREAVEACRNNPDIDLVLMDIKMPDMGGYEATRKIRQFNKSLPVIAQTAYGLAGDRGKALEAGCNDYISKPINRKELFDIILKHLIK